MSEYKATAILTEKMKASVSLIDKLHEIMIDQRLTIRQKDCLMKVVNATTGLKLSEWLKDVD